MSLFKNNIEENKLKGFCYVVESECIVDQNDQTLIYLEQLNNYNAII